MAQTPSSALVADVLAGHSRAMARLITRAEAADGECLPALADVYRHTGRAHVVGITGVPGSGKSTLVRAIAQRLRQREQTVAVVAIDPSSPYSGGAILGDRIRMNDIAGDPGIFIRSMATRGALGGLASATLDAVDILDAGGFDIILIETVGVGQDEVDVVRAAHTTVVVSAPGLGDDIQAIKAGVLEIADIHVVSKADRSDANKTVTELKQMLMMALADDMKGRWAVPVLPTSAETDIGLDALVDAIGEHRDHMERTGEIRTRRKTIAETRTLKIAESLLRARFAARRETDFREVLDQVSRRDRDPHHAALDLLELMTAGGEH